MLPYLDEHEVLRVTYVDLARSDKQIAGSITCYISKYINGKYK